MGATRDYCVHIEAFRVCKAERVIEMLDAHGQDRAYVLRQTLADYLRSYLVDVCIFHTFNHILYI